MKVLAKSFCLQFQSQIHLEVCEQLLKGSDLSLPMIKQLPLLLQYQNRIGDLHRLASLGSWFSYPMRGQIRIIMMAASYHPFREDFAVSVDFRQLQKLLKSRT